MRKEVHWGGLWVDYIQDWDDKKPEYDRLLKEGDWKGIDKLKVTRYMGTRKLFGRITIRRSFDTHMAPILENIPGITREI